MHIVADRESISKYGLVGLIDPKDNGTMTLAELLSLLGMEPGGVAPGPLYDLYIKTLQLDAHIEAVCLANPDTTLTSFELSRVQESLSEAGTSWISSAMCNHIINRVRAAAGLDVHGRRAGAAADPAAAAQPADDETAGQAEPTETETAAV